MSRRRRGLDFRGYFALAVIAAVALPTTRPMVLDVARRALASSTSAPVTGRPGALAGAVRPALTLPADMPRAVQLARTTRTRWGVPVSVTLGQAMLESGPDLGSGLARRWRNYFGVKCGRRGSPYAAGCTEPLGTTECRPRCAPERDTFRAYRSPDASFLDYGRVLSLPLYAAAHRHRGDPAGFVRAVAAAGYATTPGYADRVLDVIARHNLRRYDR